MKSSGLPALAGDMARGACFFDIVNGFFNRCRGDMVRFLCVSARTRMGTG